MNSLGLGPRFGDQLRFLWIKGVMIAFSASQYTGCIMEILVVGSLDIREGR